MKFKKIIDDFSIKLIDKYNYCKISKILKTNIKVDDNFELNYYIGNDLVIASILKCEINQSDRSINCNFNYYDKKYFNQNYHGIIELIDYYFKTAKIPIFQFTILKVNEDQFFLLNSLFFQIDYEDNQFTRYILKYLPL
ncbi:MAG: hypothetical protein ACRCW6_03260 [Mycoplasmoidaceae bacterium]